MSPSAVAPAFGDLLVRRQELQRAVQPAGLFQELDETLLRIEEPRRDASRDRQHLRLEIVVAQHQHRDLVGHRGELRVALLLREPALGDRESEQDLDVDLVVGRVHAGGVVDRIRVDPAAGPRVLDAAELRAAEVAAFDDDLAAEIAAVDAHQVVGAVADVGVRLPRRLHVRADAAVVEEIDRRLEDGVHQLGRRQRVGGDRERGLDLRRDRDRLDAARMDAAARRDEARVVIRPRGARETEQALALGEARRHVRIRIEEDMPVVERGDEPDVPRQQHAVAEDVARHVADAGHREVGRLDVDALLAEMPLRRFPGAARGDPHRLVVVADRTARRERVGQPEAVLLTDGIRMIGECRRALVGGDDEIRIVGVVPLHLRRRHDLPADAVVGEIEQAAQIILVAGDALAHQRLAIRRRRRALQHEAALGPDRDDHRVLDHLRLHQAEDLGAEILRTIRPAQSAARDLAAAQVHALEPGRVDEDLEHRLGLGQARHLGGIELERQECARASGVVAPPEVGPGRRLDQRQVFAQHAVFRQALHRIERRRDRPGILRAVHDALGPQCRIEAGLEHADQQARDVRDARQASLRCRPATAGSRSGACISRRRAAPRCPSPAIARPRPDD